MSPRATRRRDGRAAAPFTCSSYTCSSTRWSGIKARPPFSNTYISLTSSLRVSSPRTHFARSPAPHSTSGAMPQGADGRRDNGGSGGLGHRPHTPPVVPCRKAPTAAATMVVAVGSVTGTTLHQWCHAARTRRAPRQWWQRWARSPAPHSTSGAMPQGPDGRRDNGGSGGLGHRHHTPPVVPCRKAPTGAATMVAAVGSVTGTTHHQWCHAARPRRPPRQWWQRWARSPAPHTKSGAMPQGPDGRRDNGGSGGLGHRHHTPPVVPCRKAPTAAATSASNIDRHWVKTLHLGMWWPKTLSRRNVTSHGAELHQACKH